MVIIVINKIFNKIFQLIEQSFKHKSVHNQIKIRNIYEEQRHYSDTHLTKKYTICNNQHRSQPWPENLANIIKYLSHS